MTVVKIKKQQNAKETKNCVIKRKRKFGNYKTCLEATQPDNKKNYLEKSKININSFKENQKKLRENKKSMLKTQQRFKSERHTIFTEKINKIALSSNYDRNMQSFDSIKTYAFGASKYLVSEKEGTKCNNIIKQCKK